MRGTLKRNAHLDGETFELSNQFLQDRGTLDELSSLPPIADTTLLGRLLQLPTVKPAASNNVESELGYDTIAMESYVMADAMLKPHADDRVT